MPAAMLERSPRMGQWLSCLDELRTLKPDWDTQGGEVPTEKAYKTATAFLEILDSQNLPPTGILPSGEGGIVINFKRGSRYADVECFNSGGIGALICDEEKAIVRGFEIETTKAFGSFTRVIHEFLASGFTESSPERGLFR